MRHTDPLKIRPYQLLCAICSLGGPLPDDGRRLAVERLKAAVRENPDIPLTLVCNAGDLYAWQDPGPAEDTPEGADFNRKRDLDSLQRMGWTPGITLPARVDLHVALSLEAPADANPGRGGNLRLRDVRSRVGGVSQGDERGL